MRGWAGVLLLLGGCSFLFVTPPPEHAAERSYAPDCSTSQAAPVIDTLLAAYQVVRVGYAASLSDEDYKDQPLSRNADIGFGIGFAVLSTASAAYGFSGTSACQQAKAEWEDRHRSGPRADVPETPAATPMDQCSSDANCPPGLRCMFLGDRRYCNRPVGPPPATKPESTPSTAPAIVPTEEIECTYDGDCPRDQLCVQAGVKRICRKPSPP